MAENHTLDHTFERKLSASKSPEHAEFSMRQPIFSYADPKIGPEVERWQAKGYKFMSAEGLAFIKTYIAGNVVCKYRPLECQISYDTVCSQMPGVGI
jgi:hypothetical protein